MARTRGYAARRALRRAGVAGGGAACAAALALLVAACGGSGSPGVAALSTTATTTAAAAPPSRGGATKAGDPVAYAACMRSHGVPGFPDPARPGQFVFRVTPAMKLDPMSPVFRAARSTCGRLFPPPSGPTPQQQRQKLQGELDFAACMRRHGVGGFPDPTAQGDISSQAIAAAGIDVHSASVQAAAMACVPASHGAITAADVRRAVQRGGQ